MITISLCGQRSFSTALRSEPDHPGGMPPSDECVGPDWRCEGSESKVKAIAV